MRLYLNPGNLEFTRARSENIYVDKSELIHYTNDRVNKEMRFMCISRPRRFGKSMAANMLTAYYSRGCDSRELFSGLRIEKDMSFETHLNRHDVIRLDVQRFLFKELDLDFFIDKMQAAVLEELKAEFGDCIEEGICELPEALNRIYMLTGRRFIFIIDEWDCVFRLAKEKTEIQRRYLDFLRWIFKGAEYVELVYMTGILPIRKYGNHSALNIFREYSMLNPGHIARYFGFTEAEVEELCTEYGIDFHETKEWYDGYLLGGMHIYNPLSVVELMDNMEFQSYWTGTETYEALKVYIDMNLDGLKEAVVDMIGNGRCKIDTTTAQNDMTTFRTKDDVLTLLIHLGYLTYDRQKKETFIPNREIAWEFMRSVKTGGWDGLVQSLARSQELLRDTWEMNGKAVADGISKIHDETSSILKYHDENSLKCTVLMAYYSAQAYYLPPVLEQPSGRGFADVVYLPGRGVDRPALVVELKWKGTAMGAVSQIKNRQYASWIEEYTGDILLVGINYDGKKEHDCQIEKYYKADNLCR